jgi:hypothetical protein
MSGNNGESRVRRHCEVQVTDVRGRGRSAIPLWQCGGRRLCHLKSEEPDIGTSAVVRTACSRAPPTPHAVTVPRAKGAPAPGAANATVPPSPSTWDKPSRPPAGAPARSRTSRYARSGAPTGGPLPRGQIDGDGTANRVLRAAKQNDHCQPVTVGQSRSRSPPDTASTRHRPATVPNTRQSSPPTASPTRQRCRSAAFKDSKEHNSPEAGAQRRSPSEIAIVGGRGVVES